MKKQILLLSLIALMGTGPATQAQDIHFNVHIGNSSPRIYRPAWLGNVRIDAPYVDFPEIDVYYSMYDGLYHFLTAGVWCSARALPHALQIYDLTGLRHIALHGRSPWLYHRTHRDLYCRPAMMRPLRRISRPHRPAPMRPSYSRPPYRPGYDHNRPSYDRPNQRPNQKPSNNQRPEQRPNQKPENTQRPNRPGNTPSQTRPNQQRPGNSSSRPTQNTRPGQSQTRPGNQNSTYRPGNRSFQNSAPRGNSSANGKRGASNSSPSDNRTRSTRSL